MASERVILTWSFANWITVVLMAAVGFGVLAIVLNVWARKKGTVSA